MAIGKVRKKIKLRIPSWQCFGYYGYGQGRAVADFGNDAVKGRSVCADFCSRSDDCRKAHHAKMDHKYPLVADLVRRTAKIAKEEKRPIVQSVVAALRIAEEKSMEGIQQIRATLNHYEIPDEEIADHYVCGKLNNIQNGLEREAVGLDRNY